MIDDREGYPAEPGVETRLRYEKNRETTRAADELALEPLTVKVGDEVAGLVLEEIIGSGVTSTVFRVRERETGRRLALKVLQSRSNETLAASRVGFQHMAKIKHPSLVRLYRTVNVGKCIGFVMEEIVGCRLQEEMDKHREKDRTTVFDAARRLIRDLGSALETMHDAGLVHRDVKPENVMIDRTGRARLVDYGLIGTYDPVSDPDGRRNYLAGTYWYMAPESISEQMYPPACDIYAVGCVVMEMIADRAHLPKETLGNSFGRAIGDVQAFMPDDTPADLAELICDMLDPLAANRPIAARLACFGAPDFLAFEAPNQYRRSRFRGREREMATAEQWVHRVTDGKPMRLHINGESGVGKTWFVAELLRRIRSNPWFQVFDSACREREEISLQAFDAMADAIARRYSREDREPIKLSPKHALVLRQAFPSLRAVILPPVLSDLEMAEWQDKALPPHTPSEDIREVNPVDLARSDALLSGVELVDQMCNNGPLFLVYDDIQFADQDCINVLEKLLSDCKGEVGIITIGRGRETRFRNPPDAEVELRPLGERASVELLQELLRSRKFQWDPRALKRLAALGEGNAYRLTQLAACICHDDPAMWQARLLAGPIELEDIWNARLQKISGPAMAVLECLAIAGGPVSPGELACVGGHAERFDELIQELVDLQLVTESYQRDLVDVIHQRLAQRIIDRIEPERFRGLHQAWATYLMNRGKDQWKPAAIAGHLIHAGQAEKSIQFSIQAAREAERRFAFTEAARWYQRTAELVSGDEATEFLYQALNCFEEAGRPAEAVAICQQLLSAVGSKRDAASNLALRQRLATNLLHCGEMERAAHEIESQVTRRSVQDVTPDNRTQHFNSVRRFWDSVLPRGDQNEASTGFSIPSREVCCSAPRPLALYRSFSFLNAIRAIPILLNDLGNATACAPESQFQNAVDLAVIGCRQPGRKRRRNTARLQRLKEVADLSDCATVKASVTGGLACRHLLACDWASAITSANQSLEWLRVDRDATRFDDTYSRLALLWSYVWLGRLNDLRTATNQALSKSRESNDEYLALIATTGVAGAASLVKDDVAAQLSSCKRVSATIRQLRSPWLSVFHGFGPIMRMIYEGKTLAACRYHAAYVAGPRRAILESVQMPKVLEMQFHGLIHIRLAFEKPIYRNESLTIIRAICETLRETSIPYAKAIAGFFEAQAYELMSDRERCIELYRIAADAADSLDLVPIRLAALDRISLMTTDKPAHELNRFLVSEGVRAPEKFARLYSGLSK